MIYTYPNWLKEVSSVPERFHPTTTLYGTEVIVLLDREELLDHVITVSTKAGELANPNVMRGKLDRFGLFVENEDGQILVSSDPMGNLWCISHNCELSLCRERH